MQIGEKIVLPEGFEFIKVKPLEIKKITNLENAVNLKTFQNICSNDNISIQKLNEDEVYGIEQDDSILAFIAISKISDDTVQIDGIYMGCEIDAKKYYDIKLIKSMVGNYKQKFDKMNIVLSGENVPKFAKLGFDNFVEIKQDKLIYSKDLRK